jgi:putative transposase
MLTAMKGMPETAFLSEGYTDNLQQKLKDLHGAWKRCFDKRLAAEKPVFKRKSKGNDSVRFVNVDKYCQSDRRRVKLPSGLGWVRFRQSRAVEGKIKNVTVSQHAGVWYISFQAEIEVARPVPPSTSAIGLVSGISKLATPSDGTICEPVTSFKKNQVKLARLQRQLSRMMKFSANSFYETLVDTLRHDERQAAVELQKPINC